MRAVFVVALISACLTGCATRDTPRSASGNSAAITGGRQFGAPPTVDLEAVDIYTDYHLPKLRDQPAGDLSKSITHLQLIARARDLGLISRSALRAWQSSSLVASLSQENERAAGGEIAFNGNKASELNQLLSTTAAKTVRVAGKSLTVDEPISIRRSDLRLDLGTVAVRGNPALNYLVIIEKVHDVDVRGGAYLAGDSGILVNDSQRVRISDATIHGLGGTGIVITGSSAVVVRGSHISGLKYAGIILHRGVNLSLIEENRIEDNAGTANLAAAILLTDREVDLASNSRAIYGPDSYHVIQQTLATRRHPPSGNLIRANVLQRNQSAGIYSDGGIRNVFVANRIAGNAKEGICLHNGSIANVLTGNAVLRNGERWGEPDAVLRMENIADAGRFDDGTPAASLPGISLDNALYNIVFQNSVVNNYGGGIKMVRTSLFNVIGLNTLTDNAEGDSDDLHFSGIELGAAPSDNSSTGLDITPARGNIVFSNLIRGSHYTGLNFEKGSDENDVFDNVIMDATKWALASVRTMSNTTVNNITNLPSKNIAPGIDPRLFVVGRAIMDPQITSPDPL